MRSTTRSLATKALFVAALVLVIAPAVLAHGDDEGMDMDMGDSMGGSSMGMTAEPAPPAHNATGNGTTNGTAEIIYKPTYFAHPEHVGLMYAHILLMTVAWVFALPVCEYLFLFFCF